MFIILFYLSIIITIFGLISLIINLVKKQNTKKSIMITVIGISLLVLLLLISSLNLSKSGNQKIPF